MSKKIKKVVWGLWMFGVVLILFPILKMGILVEKTASTNWTYDTTIIPYLDETEEALAPPELTDIIKMEGTVPYAGVLNIPGIQLTLPISFAFTDKNLLVSAVSLFPERDVKTSNTVLMGHHLSEKDVLFGKLNQVKVGDSLLLTLNNQTYHYVVETVQIIKETDITWLEPTEESALTLVTCDQPTYTDQRLVVRGTLKKEENAMEEWQRTVPKIMRQSTVIKKKIVKYRLVFIAGLVFISIVSWQLFKNESVKTP